MEVERGVDWHRDVEDEEGVDSEPPDAVVALEDILGLDLWCWSGLGFQDEVVDDPWGDAAWMQAEGGGLAPQAQRVGLWSSGEPDSRKQTVE